MRPQVRSDLARLGPDRRVEGVRQAVRDVRRDDERAYPALRTQDCRRGRDARLADAAFARVEQDLGQRLPPAGTAIVRRGSAASGATDSSGDGSPISTRTAPVTFTNVVSPHETRQSR